MLMTLECHGLWQLTWRRRRGHRGITACVVPPPGHPQQYHPSSCSTLTFFSCASQLESHTPSELSTKPSTSSALESVYRPQTPPAFCSSETITARLQSSSKQSSLLRRKNKGVTSSVFKRRHIMSQWTYDGGNMKLIRKLRKWK